MKNMLILLTTMVTLGTALVGCNGESQLDSGEDVQDSQSSESTQVVGTSDGATQQVLDLSHDEEDAKWDGVISDFYTKALASSYCDEIYVVVKESTKLVDMTIVIPDGTSDEDGLERSTNLVKLFNDTAIELDDTFSESSEGYYGGMFDEYDLNITVATPDTAMYESQWLVFQTIQAGTHDAIVKGGYVS